MVGDATGFMISYQIEAGTGQHIGNRAQQSDRAAILSGKNAPGYVLAVLSDGVAGGPAASEQVLHTAKLVFDQFRPGETPKIERLEELLREIVHETHLVVKMNAMASEKEQLGTFVALALSPHGEAVWAHVGDSRFYRFEKGSCRARTNDEAYIDHLIDNENVSPEAAVNHRHSKSLQNLLGSARKEPFVTIGSHVGFSAGDSFLLCSDGLWSYFTDAELANALYKHSPRKAAELLIEKAQERANGKGDNCTMAIVKLVKEGKKEPEPSEPKLSLRALTRLRRHG